MQCKGSRRREAIQGLAASVARRGDVVLPLIQIDAGLLPVRQVGVQFQTVHAHRHPLRNFAGDHGGAERQVLFGPHRAVVARHDARRRQHLLKAGDDLRRRAVHALIERLKHKVFAVTVHDQARKPVGLAVYQAVGGAIVHQSPPEIGRGLEAPGEEAPVNVLHAAAEHSQADLRAGAIVRRPQGAPPRVDDRDRVAGRGRSAIENVAREDPGMAGVDPRRCLAVNPNDGNR
jgi:hypothetical protein